MFTLFIILLSHVYSLNVQLSFTTYPQRNIFDMLVQVGPVQSTPGLCTIQMLFATDPLLMSSSDQSLHFNNIYPQSCNFNLADCSKSTSFVITNIQLSQPILPKVNVTSIINSQNYFTSLTGIDPTTLSVDLNLQQSNYQAFRAGQLTVSFIPYFQLLQGTTFQLTFPLMISSDTSNIISFINKQSLSCQGLLNIEPNLICSFNNNVLSVTNGYTQPRTLNYNLVSFQLSGFINNYIIADIFLHLLIFYNGVLSVGDSPGTISTNQFHTGTYTLESQNSIRLLTTTLRFSLMVDSYLTTTSSVEIIFPFQIKNSLTLICAKNCIQGTIQQISNEIVLNLQSQNPIVNDILVFELQNIVNPDVGVYDFDITITNSDSSVVSTGLAEYTIYGNQIKDLALQLNSTVYGQPSEYTFTWTTPFQTFPGLLLELTLPLAIPEEGYLSSEIFYFSNKNTMTINNFFAQGQNTFTLSLSFQNPYNSIEDIFIAITFDDKIISQSNSLTQSYAPSQLKIISGFITSPDTQWYAQIILHISLLNPCQYLILEGVDTSNQCQVNYQSSKCPNGYVPINGINITLSFTISYPRSNKPLNVNISAIYNGIVVESYQNYELKVNHIRPIMLQDSVINFKLLLGIQIGEQFTVDQNFTSKSIQYHQVDSNYILDASLNPNQTYDIILASNRTTNIQFLTVDNYIICQSAIPFMQNASTYTQTSHQFSSFKIEPQNLYFYQSVAYNLQFTNNFEITSYLYLELQQNIEYAYCQYYSCTPFQNGIKIQFNESVSPGNHSVIINNVQNPDYAGIFSYFLYNPGIESAIYSQFTMFTCPDHCSNCTLQQNGAVQCTQCQTGYAGQDCMKVVITQNINCTSNCSECKESICLVCDSGLALQLGKCILPNNNTNEQSEKSEQTVTQSYYLLCLTLAIVLICAITKFRKCQIFYFRMFVSLIQSYELIADLMMTIELALIGQSLFYIALAQVISRCIGLLVLNSSLKTQLQNIKGRIYQILKIATLYYSWKIIFIFTTRLSNQMNKYLQFNQVLIIDTFARLILLIGLCLNSSIINLDYLYFLSISLIHQIILLTNIKIQEQRLLRKMPNV